MSHNVENRTEQSMFGKVFGMFGTRPDLRSAAKMGEPAMTALMPTTPPGVTPTTGVGPAAQPSAEVTAETISGPSALDTEPDARQGGAGQQGAQEQESEQPQP